MGLDQKQHLELARDIAIRFNSVHGETFTVPEGYFGEKGAKIASLQDPGRKMSKSDPAKNGSVFILDPPDLIRKKIKSAVTDSEARVACRPGKDGVVNLMTIYSCCTGKTFDEIENEFEGLGYGAFKDAVGQAVVEKLAPVQDTFSHLMADKGYLESCCRQGAQKARSVAAKTLAKVYKKVGFLAE